MKFIETSINGIFIIEPTIFNDDRGYFYESFREDKFIEKIGDIRFIQDNEAKSNYGVLRGLHYQKDEYAQSKLVRVVIGSVLDVAVDIRKNSPTYGKYVSVKLSGENKKQFFIPRGFAHGYVVLENNTIFSYKCDNYYAPEHEGSIIYNDPTININWIIPDQHLIISNKDKNNERFDTKNSS